MIKRQLLFLFAAFLPLAAVAQDDGEKNIKDHDVYLELLGASTMIGVNYDARFNDHTRWGWRAGLGFAYSESDGFFNGSTSTRGWGVPVGVNYLIGSRKNNLEIGLGVNLGLYNLHNNTYTWKDVDEATFNREADNPSPGVSGTVETVPGKYYLVYKSQESQNKFGYYFFGDIGYRHVNRHGFLFRVGLSPSFNFGDRYAICRGFTDSFHKFALSGYIAFGYAF